MIAKYKYKNSHNDEYSTYYVGYTEEIASLYKSLRKACRRGLISIHPAFQDYPKFNSEKLMYCIMINSEGEFTIITSDTMLAIMIESVPAED